MSVSTLPDFATLAPGAEADLAIIVRSIQKHVSDTQPRIKGSEQRGVSDVGPWKVLLRVSADDSQGLSKTFDGFAKHNGTGQLARLSWEGPGSSLKADVTDVEPLNSSVIDQALGLDARESGYSILARNFLNGTLSETFVDQATLSERAQAAWTKNPGMEWDIFHAARIDKAATLDHLQAIHAGDDMRQAVAALVALRTPKPTDSEPFGM